MFGLGGVSSMGISTRDSGSAAPPSAPALLHGTLQRRESGPGGLLKIWKQRYLGQKGTVLTVFSSEYEQGPDHILDTLDIKEIDKVEPRPKHRFSFEITRKTKEGIFLQADTQEIYAKWLAGLSDWQNFLRKNPAWGTGAEDAAADEALEQLIVSLLEPEQLAAIRPDIDAKVQSKLNSLNGLERLVGFYSSDPAAQQKAALEVEQKKHVVEKIQEVQRRLHRLMGGDKVGVAREELHVIEERLKKQLSGFDGVEKLAAIYPPGSQQAQSVQLQLRLLSEGIAVLEQQKQRLNILCQGGGAGEIFADVAYDFEAAGEGELDLKAGDVVTVREKTSEEWWTGECNGRIGLFPSAYVVERPQPVTPPPAAAPKSQPAPVVVDDKPAQKTARALYAFEAASDVELELRQDDVVTLIECEPGAEWWRGSLPDGRDGMFPSAYVELIEQPAPKPQPVAQPVAQPVKQPIQQPQPQPKPQPKAQPPQQPLPQGMPKPVRQQPLPKPKQSQPIPQQPAPAQQPPSAILSPRGSGGGRGAPQKRQVPAKGLPPPPPGGPGGPGGPGPSSLPAPAPITADILYEFQAQNVGELSVSPGWVVEIVDTSHSDWTIVRAHGQVGAVPSNYLRLVSPLAAATPSVPAPAPEPVTPVYAPPAPAPESPPSPPVVKPTAISNYVFTPEAATELALQPGDLVTLSDYDPTAEWWSGSLPDGRSGVFPSSYVSLQY